MFVGIGLISYSAYLWHQPLIAFYKLKFPTSESGPILAGLAAIPLAWLTWRFVENPFRTKRLLPVRETMLGASVAASILLASLGGFLLLNNGWEARFSPNERIAFAKFAEGPDYVPERFDALHGKPFPEFSSRRNILIIGDSFAQDLVNALYEADIIDELNVSTYHISAKCGNLHIEDLTRYQLPEDVAGCGYNRGYNLPGLESRMALADEIWLSSSWKLRSLPLLRESLGNIQEMTDTPLTVFSRKHFGKRSVSDYYDNGLESLLGQKSVPENLAEVQRLMHREIPEGVRFIDIQDLMCGDYDQCTNLDSDGMPLTFDGSHLTRYGAAFLGHRLKPLLDASAETVDGS